MIEMRLNAEKFVTDWVASKIDIKDFGPNTTFGFFDSEKLVGGIVFNEYRIQNIAFSGVIEDKRCFTKFFLKKFFDYPFNQLKCHRITSYTEVDNDKANTLLKKLGFINEGIMREISEKGKDVNIYGMLKRECRWI
jgi:RimJ/RimL family protein N-acetyltransferase